MEAIAYVYNADTGEIYYIVSGPSREAVQDYVETEYGAYIFDEWAVSYGPLHDLYETTGTKEIEINEKGEEV